ncbi:MAG TPA: hypothetical protein VF390_00365 [Patescibacteria group bacterium]
MIVSEINYLEIIKTAARVTWRNKYLWWFGFFSLLSTISGNFFQVWSRGKNIQGQEVLDFTASHEELVIFLASLLLFLWVIFVVLGIIAKGGLIKSLKNATENKKFGLKNGLREGKKYFWKVFLIGAFSAVFILATLIVFMIPIGFLFYNKAYFLGGLLSLLAMVIFIPVLFLVSFIRIYAYFYVILSDLPLSEALENAYALLRKNIVPSLIISLIFLVVGTLATVVAFLFIIPIIVIFFLIGTLLFFLAQQVGILITALAGLTFMFLVMIFGGSIYQVFAQAILLLFFYEIATPKIKEEVEAEKIVELGPAHAPDPVVGN